MNCDPAELASLSRCYCLGGHWRRAWIYSLCQWANNLTPPAVTKFTFAPASEIVSWTSAAFPGGTTGNLAAISLDDPTTITDVDFLSNGVTSISGVGFLTGLVNFTCNNCASLVSIEGNTLTTIGGQFNCQDSADLATIDFPLLQFSIGNFYAVNCPSLTAVDLPSLSFVGGNISFDNSLNIVTLNFPLLTTINFTFSCTGCAALTTLNLPLLGTIGANFTPQACVLLTTLNLPSLTSIGGFWLSNNCLAMTTINIPLMTTLGGDFESNNCANLVNFVCSSWVPTDLTGIGIVGDAVNQVSIELIMRRCVLAGVSNCIIDLSGGTNFGAAGLSAQGTADVATLGAQLTINP